MTVMPSVGFEHALIDAYRRAYQRGLTEIGTDLVLYHVVRRIGVLYGRLPRTGPEWRAVTRGRSGLVDPPPPPRTRLAPDFDDDVAFEATAVLREASYLGLKGTTGRPRRDGTHRTVPEFTPAVRYAVYEAIHEARRRGVHYAAPGHLALGLLAVPEGAAATLATGLLRERWEVGHDLAAVLRADPRYRAEGRPQQGSATLLNALLVFPARQPRHLRSRWRFVAWLGRGAWRLLVWLLLELWLRRPYRRHGARYGHPLPMLVEGAAYRHAARSGQVTATSAHVVLGILDLHGELDSAGLTLPEDVARWNEAHLILAEHGVTLRRAAREAVDVGSEPADDEDDHTGIPTRGWITPRPARPGVPQPGRTFLLGLRNASLAARRDAHPCAGTTHVLVEVLADPTGPAARLLRRLDCDPDAIRAQAARHLEAAARASAGRPRTG